MQTDELRTKNREKQRAWRLKNLERSRELKRLANWKVRGIPKPKVSKIKIEKPPKPVKPPKAKKEPKPQKQSQKPRKNASVNDSDFPEGKGPPIDISLCTNCFRKYLSKYHCMWCNGDIKEPYGRYCTTASKQNA